jgi:predicted MPP superfamily phosphohydrolase
MKSKKRIALAGVAALAAAGVAAKTVRFLVSQTKDIQISEYLYRTDRIDEEFDGFRIANVSDLQSEYFGEMQRELLEIVEEAEPDIIVITGDLVDRTHTDFMAATKAVSGLLKIAPVYYVNGNHEVRISETRMQPFYAELRQMGVKVLLDESVIVIRGESHINVVGLSEFSIYGARALAEGTEEWEPTNAFTDLLETLRSPTSEVEHNEVARKVRELCDKTDDAFTLLLAHEPQLVDAYAEGEPDLVMCGHAHGGQFRMPNGQGWFAPNQGALPKYTAGLYECGDGYMLVSRGLGNSVFPIRLNNRPEVTVMTLLRK